MFAFREGSTRLQHRPLVLLLAITVVVHVCISTLFFLSDRWQSELRPPIVENDAPWRRMWRWPTNHRPHQPHDHTPKFDHQDEFASFEGGNYAYRRRGRHMLDKTLDEVQKAVSRTNGFYVRDWSLWLGWNNMRYIIETALHHAVLLNRTLVLPSFVYARDCEFPHEICSAFAHLVNRAESGSEEWRALPPEDQEGWRIPIQMMFDLPEHYAVITTAQFLALQGLPMELETPNGQWDPVTYLRTVEGGRGMSMVYIPEEEYEPKGVVLVDRVLQPSGQVEVAMNDTLRERLLGLCPGGTDTEWEVVRDVIAKTLLAKEVPDGLKEELLDDAKLIEIARQYGLTPVYQFTGHEMSKLVTAPRRSFMPGAIVRGWVDEYAGLKAEILWLQGEQHAGRGPGSIRFTSRKGIEAYQDMVLQDMRFPPGIEEAAERIAERIRERLGGRMWIAVHMRRGDFVRLGWTLSSANDIHQHIRRIVQQVAHGRKTLAELAGTDWRDFRLADVPEVRAQTEWLEASPPGKDDPFYLATDEKNATYLDLLRAEGALLLQDLLTPEDRQLLGPGAVLTDYVSLLEQAIMIRSAFFAGHALSSVAGTVANQRGARGYDTRTTALD